MPRHRFMALRGKREQDECFLVAALLADHIGGRLGKEDLARVEGHLATCSACAATVRTLGLARQASEGARPDLWPRLQARLDERHRCPLVSFAFPALTWDAALALTAVLTVPWFAPEPVRFVAAVLAML